MFPVPVSAVDPAAATGRPILWGVKGTGSIALRVVHDLALVEDAIVHAVSSRTEASALHPAQRFGFTKNAYWDSTGKLGSGQRLTDRAFDVV